MHPAAGAPLMIPPAQEFARSCSLKHLLFSLQLACHAATQTIGALRRQHGTAQFSHAT